MILAQDTLFRSGIESSLGHIEGLKATSIVPTDITAIVAEIERAHPSSIIIDSTEVAKQAALILELLNRFPTIRLIGMSLGTNRISVYSKQEVRVTALDDLITALTI